MEKITHYENGQAILDPSHISLTEAGYIGLGVELLARYEDVHQEVLTQQTVITAQLEELRLAGKTKSTRFRELMGKKLMNSAILSLLQTHGLR